MNRVTHCIVGERKTVVGWLVAEAVSAATGDDDERRTIALKNKPTDAQAALNTYITNCYHMNM